MPLKRINFVLKTSQKKYIQVQKMMQQRFFLVNDINHKRTRTDGYKVIPQTRKIHHIKSTGKSNEIEVRNLSCFCRYCMQHQPEDCVNQNYVNPFQLNSLKAEETCIFSCCVCLFVLYLISEFKIAMIQFCSTLT